MTVWVKARADVADPPVGQFAEHADIGAPAIAGSTSYDDSIQHYRMSASGINLWGASDQFQFAFSIFILSMVVLGGMGNVWGSIVGAAVIVVVPEVIRSAVPSFQQYRFLVFGAVLVIVMIFRPQGLIPSRRRAMELETADGPV